MLSALWLWRQFPRQIASDLSQFHHRRIAEWHSGLMSSYELLELLEYMPERGDFKKAVRGGEFSEEEIVWRHIANKLSRIESIAYVQATHKESDPPRMFWTLAELKDMVAQEESIEERREDFFSFAERTPDMLDLDEEQVS